MKRAGASHHRRIAIAKGLVAALVFIGTTGCGIALYGPPILLLLLAKKSNAVRTTFPDVAISSVEAPSLASAVIGATAVKDASGASGLPVTQLTFPGIYGRSESDRLAGQTTVATDELLLQINGDSPQVVKVGVASVGTVVAANIQAAVRKLAPSTGSSVPTDAYALFACTFDPVIQEYALVSGVPGAASAVVVNPAATGTGTGTGAVAPSKAAVACAANLKLGVANGGHERAGAENLSYVIFNHGTDVMPTGMPVNVWLSKSKTLDKTQAVLVRQDKTNAAVEVAIARRFTSTNQPLPQATIQGSIPAGQYFLIFEANPDGASGSEKKENLGDNTRTFSRPIEVSQSIAVVSSASGGGSGGGASPPTRALDMAPTDVRCSIAGVSGRNVQVSIEVQNFGAPVTAPLPMTVDVVLGQNGTFAPPTTLTDPAGALAGLFVNPVDFTRQARLVLQANAGAGQKLQVSVSGDTVTASWDGNADVTPVASLTAAIAQNASQLLDLPADGNGNPATDSLTKLVKAAGLSTSGATLQVGGRLISRTTQTFAVSPLQETRQLFQYDVALPTSFPSGQLPRKFILFARVTPVFPATGPLSNTTAGVEDATNNVRTARNYLRIVSPSTAVFDNGTFLPTGDPNDFQPFAAVTGRPTTSGLVQGHQAIFRFQIPQTGIPLDESQLLMLVQTSQFDPHLELLDSTGHTIVSSDDSALGLEPLIYTPALATQGNPNFYAIVSNASFTDQTAAGGGAAFALVISVNPRLPADASLAAAVPQEDLFQATDTAVSKNPTVGLVENDKLIEFNLAQQKAEVMFVLPAFARVRFKSTPIFATGVNTTITQFLENKPVTQVAFQAEVDPATLEVVYRPSGGTIDTSHLLSPGVYTFSFSSLNGPDPTVYQLEVDADYVPQGTK